MSHTHVHSTLALTAQKEHSKHHSTLQSWRHMLHKAWHSLPMMLRQPYCSNAGQVIHALLWRLAKNWCAMASLHVSRSCTSNTTQAACLCWPVCSRQFRIAKPLHRQPWQHAKPSGLVQSRRSRRGGARTTGSSRLRACQQQPRCLYTPSHAAEAGASGSG